MRNKSKKRPRKKGEPIPIYLTPGQKALADIDIKDKDLGAATFEIKDTGDTRLTNKTVTTNTVHR
jgi:hypothetical protein